ncbi:MAG: shikimate kinase [Flavobacteriaceae bacterium]|nr:shikimate kinase [Flavobacteriaceae bacterium]
MKKIVLIGYMASGKSAVGALLAKKSALKFIDLDSYIVSKIGLSIATVFKEKGEIFFRKIERKYLLEILDQQTSFILSVGGGTPCYGDNMEIINKFSLSVFLRTPVNTLTKRLQNEKQDRPLVASLNNEKLTEFVAKHLFERNPFYEKSKVIIETGEKDILEIVTEISKLSV